MAVTPLSITPGSGAPIATNLIDSKYYQLIQRMGGDASAVYFYRDCLPLQDTFTSTGTGTVGDVSSQGMSKFSLQVSATGTPASWTVVLEVSNDGVNYSQVLKHMKTGDGTETVEGDGEMAFTATPFAARYFRARVTALDLTGGTNIIVTALGMP